MARLDAFLMHGGATSCNALIAKWLNVRLLIHVSCTSRRTIITTPTTSESNAGTTIGIIIVVLLAVIAGAYFMDASKDNGTSNVDNALEEFSESADQGRIGEGIAEGSEELRDRSAAERVGDSIGDTGRDLQDAATD